MVYCAMVCWLGSEHPLTFVLALLLQLKKQKAEEAAAQVAAEIEAREAEAAAADATIAAEEARQKQAVEVCFRDWTPITPLQSLLGRYTTLQRTGLSEIVELVELNLLTCSECRQWSCWQRILFMDRGPAAGCASACQGAGSPSRG